MNLTFASGNKGKLSEVAAVLEPLGIKINGLDDIGFSGEIPETADTLKGNALIKAEFVFNKFGINCFADDSGLEVEALNGAPGVFSARYAGAQKSDAANISKLLSELEGEKNRKACFKTVIALIIDGKTHIFEGIIEGTINQTMLGKNGFGYDPVFIPNGYSKTFAEMTKEEKNKISHRALAVKQMFDFLKAVK